jgi:hypothetical protein
MLPNSAKLPSKGRNMTLKYMQGFETMRDDSDLRSQGWIAAPSPRAVALAPSITGITGTSMRYMGASTSNTSGNGSASVPDLGHFNTGITVNQAWQAGGFTYGFFAKFNSGVNASYGAGQSITNTLFNSAAVCFDGTKYWAIQLLGGAYNVATSTDLISWTVTPTQPTAMSANASLSYVGNNTIVVILSTSTSNALPIYYTNNNGSSWSNQIIANAFPSAGSTVVGAAAATGNATYPHVVWGASGITNGGIASIYVGTIGGTMTQISSFSGSGSGYFTMAFPIRNIGGYLCVLPGMNGTSKMLTAQASNANLNTAGAWSTMTSSAATPVIVDVDYIPSSNLWVFATLSGIYTAPNAGAAGTIVPLTGTVTLTSRYTTAAMTNVRVIGSTVVAVGASGHIITSTDGITWTESGGHILPVGVSGSDWRNLLYNGSQYVLFSDQTNGVIATTPDLQTNYVVKYVAEPAENSAWVNGNGHSAVYAGTAPSPSTGQWAVTNNFFGIAVGSLSAGTRAVHVVSAPTGTEGTFNITNANTIFGHYYELVCIATATANTFTHQIYVDGSLVYTSGNTGYVMGSSTSDTTSLLILALDRFATFTAYDDIYFTLNDGLGLSGPLGVVNIVAQRPTTDSQAQWVKSGSAASNSLSVNQPAMSSQSVNYVNSTNGGDKDIYTTTDVLPAGYTPKAVQNEAYFTKTSTSAPVVSVGSISGASESDSSTVTISGTGATYVSQIQEKDPNGNVAWTAANVNALKFAINHVS